MSSERIQTTDRALAGQESNPLGAGTAAAPGQVHTKVYESTEAAPTNTVEPNIIHHEHTEQHSTPVVHHEERRVEQPVVQEVKPVQPVIPVAVEEKRPEPVKRESSHREKGEQLVPENEKGIKDVSQRPYEYDADDHRENRHGVEDTKYSHDNRQEAGGIRPKGVEDTRQGPRDQYENQSGSAQASDHKRVDPSDVDVSIGSKGAHDSTYSETTSSSNMGGTSVPGGEGSGINRQTDANKTTGGMGKRDSDAMGGGGGIIGKMADKMHVGKGNTHTTKGTHEESAVADERLAEARTTERHETAEGRRV